MATFLVRWPDHKVSLVVAHSPVELYQQLDLIGEPEECQVTSLTTPLCINLQRRTPPTKSKEEEMDEKLLPPHTRGAALDSFASLLGEPRFSDVVIRAEGRSVHCHKVILASRCAYFRAMFESGMKESDEGIVELSGFSHTVVHKVLEYLYSGVLNVYEATVGRNVPCEDGTGQEEGGGEGETGDGNEENATFLELVIQLIQAADYFDIPTLRQLCIWELYSACKLGDLRKRFWMIVKTVRVAEDLNLEDLLQALALLLAKDLSGFHEYDHCPDKGIATLYHQFSGDFQSRFNHVCEKVLRLPPLNVGIRRNMFHLLHVKKGQVVSLNQLRLLTDENPQNSQKLYPFHAIHEIFSSKSCINRDCATTAPKAKVLLDSVGHFVALGFDINEQDMHGDTVLHLCAQNLLEELLSQLLDHAADPHVRNHQGKTAYDLGREVHEELSGFRLFFNKPQYWNEENTDGGWAIIKGKLEVAMRWTTTPGTQPVDPVREPTTGGSSHAATRAARYFQSRTLNDNFVGESSLVTVKHQYELCDHPYLGHEDHLESSISQFLFPQLTEVTWDDDPQVEDLEAALTRDLVDQWRGAGGTRLVSPEGYQLVDQAIKRLG